MSTRNRWIRASGICGVVSLILSFTCIMVAIAFAPQFGWTDNALSDLGIVSGTTSILFNSGLILSGTLTLIFASGLFTYFKGNSLGQVGAFVLMLDSVALTAIGIFPENIRPTHLYVSVSFFALFPISMLFVTAAYLRASDVKMGLFSIAVALCAALVWIVQFLFKYVHGVAIPEALSAAAASLWVIVLTYKMVKASSRLSEPVLNAPLS